MSNVTNIDGTKYEHVVKNMPWYQKTYGNLWNVAWMHDQPWNEPDAKTDAMLERKRIAIENDIQQMEMWG